MWIRMGNPISSRVSSCKFSHPLFTLFAALTTSSQWTTMLDRIGDMLDEAQIRYSRLDGTMTREDRAKACDDLKYNKKVEVLLVSTRAGGVGLNLTTASRCFLVDPNWNPSVEAQAIDRIVCLSHLHCLCTVLMTSIEWARPARSRLSSS
jgi:hypothetical protein